MSSKFALAEYFVENNPKAAARVLEAIAASEASRFIDGVPDTQSSRLLAAMLPHHAARCVSQLSAEAAAKYLAGLEPRAVAIILRHASSADAGAILEKMPRAFSVRVSIVLNYSLSMAGAWAEPNVFILPADCTIGDGQKRLEQESSFDFHQIFVVDSDQKLQGFVRLGQLLSGPKDGLISSVLSPAPFVLKASTSLDSAMDDPGWETSDYLPVVDRRGRFVGVLRYVALRAASLNPRPQSDERDLSGTFMDLAETCYIGLADVMSSTLAADGSDQEKGR